MERKPIAKTGFSIKIPQKKEGTVSFSSFFFCFFLLFSGLFGSAGGFLSAFSFPVSFPVFACIAAAVSLFYTALFFPWPFVKNPVLKQLPFFVSLFLLAALGFGFRRSLHIGFLSVYNFVIDAYRAKEDLGFLNLPLPELLYPREEEVSALIFLLFLFLILALFMAFFLIRERLFFAAFLLSALPLVIPFAFHIIPSYGPVVCLLLFWSMLLFQSNGSSFKIRSFLFLIPSLALILLLSFFFPRENYSRNASLENLRLSVIQGNFFEDLFSGQSTVKFLAGSSNSVNLNTAGNLRFTGDIHLEVSSFSRDAQYLKGFTGSVYENGVWEPFSSQTENHLNRILQGQEVLHFPSLFETYLPLDFYPEETQSISIRHVISHGNTVYSPYGLVSDREDLADMGLSIVQDGYVQASGFRAPEEYTFSFQHVPSISYFERLEARFPHDASSFLPLNDEGIGWIYLMDQSSILDYAAQNPFHLETLEFLRVAENYVDFLYEYDTQLPDELRKTLLTYCRQRGLTPENYISLWSFVQDIIRTVWSENTYTLSPGAVPEGQDPIAWFLLENHKGYCVHFASSVTAILRAWGIPARYADGYTVSPDDFTSSDGWASIPDYRAHAWVEIYASGAGWLPLEATPGMENGAMDYPEETERATEEEIVPEETETQTEEETIPEETETTPETVPETQESQGGLPGEDTPSGNRSSFSLRSLLPFAAVFGSLILLFALAAALRALRLYFHRRSVAQADRNRGALCSYKRSRKLEKALNLKPDKNVYELVLKARFSQHILTKNELKQVWDYETALSHKAMAQFSFWKRLFWKYILAIL